MKLQIVLLIEELNRLQDKGNTEVELDGTLMCESDGNSIIATTTAQW